MPPFSQSRRYLMQKIACSSCGAVDFTELPNGNLQCNYCGSIYFKSPTFAKERTAETVQIRKHHLVSGIHCSNLKFVVHNKLLVSGMDNEITFCSSLENAEHVSTLEITGMCCAVEIMLADNASYTDFGMNNKFKHL